MIDAQIPPMTPAVVALAASVALLRAEEAGAQTAHLRGRGPVRSVRTWGGGDD
jgi:hypothetical protein